MGRVAEVLTKDGSEDEREVNGDCDSDDELWQHWRQLEEVKRVEK